MLLRFYVFYNVFVYKIILRLVSYTFLNKPILFVAAVSGMWIVAGIYFDILDNLYVNCL